MFMTLIARFRLCLYFAAECISRRVTLLVAIPRGGTTRVRCLLIGDSWLHRYLRSQFGDDQQKEPPESVREPFWKIAARLKAGRSDFDLCFMAPPLVLARWSRKNAEQTVYQSVTQVVNTTDWPTVRSRLSPRRRTQVNRLEREGTAFSVRESRDYSDLVFFYERMFVPFVRSRFGASATIPEMAAFQEHFARGFLLIAMRATEPVGGAFLVSRGKLLEFRWIGILDGDEALLASGVQMALYFHMLKYAVAHEFDQLDLGNSAPFLSDGIYRHKAQWGGLPSPSHEFGAAEYLFLGGGTKAATEFFRQFPLIVKNSGGLGVLAGVPASPPGDLAWADDFSRAHPLDGLRVIIPYHDILGRQEPLSM